MSINLSISKKRKLSYSFGKSESNTDFEDGKSPQKNSPHPRHRLVKQGTPANRGWGGRMDGFDGFSLSEPNSRKTGLDKKKRLSEMKETLAYATPKRAVDESNAIDDIEIQDSDSESEDLSHQKVQGTCNMKTPTTNRCLYVHRGSKSTNRKPRKRGLPRPRFYQNDQSSVLNRTIGMSVEELNIEIPDSPTAPVMLDSTNDISDAELPGIAQISTGSSPPKLKKKNRLSDWTKNLQAHITTPEKGNSTEPSHFNDSGKKKKSKYIRDGLADQLSKIIAREKTEHSFWTHKIKGIGKNAGNVCSFTVKLLQCVKQPSLVRATCKVLSSKIGRCNLQEGEDLTILVSPRKRSFVSCDTVLQIFAPWQTLNISGQKTLICTDFHRIVEEGDGHVTEHRKIVTNSFQFIRQAEILSEMACPCSGECSQASQCPAQQFPVIPSKLRPISTHLSLPARPGDTNEVKASSSQSSNLQCVRTELKLVAEDSILHSIEAKGGSTASEVSFTACVQRVHHLNKQPPPRSADSRVQWEHSLIVQDMRGFTCQVLLPALHRNSPLGELLMSEGKIYSFNGLKVLQRVTKERSAGLFTLFESAHNKLSQTATSAKKKEISQDSQDSDIVKPQQTYRFSYILQAKPGQAGCMIEKDDSTLYLPRQPVTISELNRWVCSSQPSRNDFQGILVYYWKANESETNRYEMLHLASEDSPGEISLISITVPDTFSCNLDLSTSVYRTLYCQDILRQSGKLVLDEYSVVEDRGRATRIKKSVDIQALASDSIPGDLVSLNGKISEIDLENAYTYTVCNVCKKESLTGGTPANPFLFCTVCRKACNNPKTRFNMIVFITYEEVLTSYDSNVKVKLSEETIQKVLPLEFDEEGYDVTAVLGRRVGPLTCVVTSLTHGDKHNKILQLEEIQI